MKKRKRKIQKLLFVMVLGIFFFQHFFQFALAGITFNQYEDPTNTLRKYDMEDIESLALLQEHDFTQFEKNVTNFHHDSDLLYDFMEKLNQIDYEKDFQENRGSDVIYFNMYDQNGFIYMRIFWKGDYTASTYRKNNGIAFFVTKATTSNSSLNVKINLEDPLSWKGWEVSYRDEIYNMLGWGSMFHELMEFDFYDYYDPIWYEPPEKRDVSVMKIGLQISLSGGEKIGDWFQEDFNFKVDGDLILFTFDESYEHVYVESLPKISERFLPSLSLMIWIFSIAFLLIAIIVAYLGFRRGFLKIDKPKSLKRKKKKK